MGRRSYAGAAKPTTLTSGINNSTLTIPGASVTASPAGGGAGPFLIVIDRGLATEEKILCDSVSGSSFIANASGRGWAAEGTAAASHNSGAVVEHVIGKVDVDEANAHVNDITTDVHPQYVRDTDLTSTLTSHSTTTAISTAINTE